MQKAKVFDIFLFIAALAIALVSEALLVNNTIFIKALIIYWLFSSLYYSLRVCYKSGSTNIDYGISYGLSMVLFAGPLGLFIFEFLYRFTVYIIRKCNKTADPCELTDTFYNIGIFVIINSLAFFLFQHLSGSFQSFPFGFWILIFLLTALTTYLSSVSLVIVLLILGELKSPEEAIELIFKRVTFLDFGKIAISNGLLYLFLQDGKWELLIILFLLNYVVSRSFYEKSQNIQTKLERDKFEQLAYTDFLTGVYNRTFMDKKMAELSGSGEYIGIVVTDIDTFKSINDTYNHAVGDKVIQHFASTLKSYLNEDDFLFRSGGEEFTLCLRNRNFEQTVALVHKIQTGIEHSPVNVEYTGDAICIFYTASFGLYYHQVNEHIAMEKAYILADELMFDSKQRGKNCVSFINGRTNKEVVLT